MSPFFRKPRKTTWPPCAAPDCADPAGGPLGGSGNVTPARLSGARFGIDGRICHRCYQRQVTAARRARTGVVRRSRWDRLGEAA